MKTFRLILEYDGHQFEGWQRQSSGHRTVQETLEEALFLLSGAPVTCVGAGRTDAGVHALGQVASVKVDTKLDGCTIARALNARLPEDLRVFSAQESPAGFNAMRDACGKHYRYMIWNGPIVSPLRRARYFHVGKSLDLSGMMQAAELLKGTQDFKSFETSGSEPGSTIRTITRFVVSGESGGEVRIDIEGDGFLRHMVRNLVGTLVEVGVGRRSATTMESLLASRLRSQAGPTAPARGLTLMSVRY